MTKLTKDQQLALKRVFDRDPDGSTSYLHFRRRAHYSWIGCVMLHWCGMWLGIEPDGYTHS